MPRGFKRNEYDTQLALGAGTLRDSRSFITLPKDGIAHLILSGIDATNARTECHALAKGMCASCGRLAPLEGEEGYRGEAHHMLHKPWNRCWCQHNLSWRCGRFVSDCHTDEHPHPQWTKKDSHAGL